MSVIAVPTQAAREAERNFARNVTQLSQESHVVPGAVSDVEFVFGRDGALTARESDGTWYSGCSVPLAAGREMIEVVKPNGNVGVFLAPPHAAAIAAVLTKLPENFAVIAVFLSERDFSLAVHCCDFAAEIAKQRVHFVFGENWAEQMAGLFREKAGLPTPTYMIRVSATQTQADVLVPVAMKVVEQETHRRSARIEELRKAPRAKNTTLCVVAPTKFRVWADAGYQLANALRDEAHVLVDVDAIDSASSLAMAEAANQCEAVISANFARCDAPQLVAPDQAWVTWVTVPRVPTYIASSQRDALIVSHAKWAELAIAAGWPKEHVAVGGWPVQEFDGKGDGALLIDDAGEVLKPGEFEYSTHGLLWDYIAEELNERPLAIGDDLEGYLNQRMRRLNIAAEGFDRAMFLQKLILPSYTKSLTGRLQARLIRADQIKSREEFVSLIRTASALVDAWPFVMGHPVRQQTRPFVKIRADLSLSAPIHRDNMPAISCSMIHRLLQS